MWRCWIEGFHYQIPTFFLRGCATRNVFIFISVPKGVIYSYFITRTKIINLLRQSRFEHFLKWKIRNLSRQWDRSPKISIWSELSRLDRLLMQPEEFKLNSKKYIQIFDEWTKIVALFYKWSAFLTIKHDEKNEDIWYL